MKAIPWPIKGPNGDIVGVVEAVESRQDGMYVTGTITDPDFAKDMSLGSDNYSLLIKPQLEVPMRFKTIWTIGAMTFAERLRRTRDWAAAKIGYALPVRIKYWVTMQMIGKAVRDSPNIPATSLDDILRKLPAPKNLS